MTVTMFDARAIAATCARLNERIRTLPGFRYSSVVLRNSGGPWEAYVGLTDLEAQADDPETALDTLSRMIERRIRHDAKLAETLGVEAA